MEKVSNCRSSGSPGTFPKGTEEENIASSKRSYGYACPLHFLDSDSIFLPLSHSLDCRDTGCSPAFLHDVISEDASSFIVVEGGSLLDLCPDLVLCSIRPRASNKSSLLQAAYKLLSAIQFNSEHL